MDYIINGQASGSVAATLLNNGFNVSALRPWVGRDGRSYIAHNMMQNDGTRKNIAVPVNNAAATLRQDEWKMIDDTVITSARKRLRLVADLRAAGLTFTVPNGMGKTVLESSVMGDITEATISMDPARISEGDRPEFDIVNLPLPVIHKDFYFNVRQIAVSRTMGTPLDTTMVELAGRKVAEEAEKLALGVLPSYAYGGGTVYGLTNFPQRVTVVLTNPATSGWTPDTLVNELLGMRQESMDRNLFGPWILYVSPGWGIYLDRDYSANKGDNTVRQRIKGIEGMSDIRTLDYLTGMQMVLVQMTSDTIREVIGMDITTVQWETLGGMRQNFKVMAIMVPQIRADATGVTGIIHGTAV